MMQARKSLLCMKQEEWEDAKYDIMKKYYVELYGEEPREARLKEYKNGVVSKGRVLRRIDVCREIFENTGRRIRPRRKRRIVIEIEWNERDQFFAENLLIKLILQGRLPMSWIRNIDLAQRLNGSTEEKKLEPNNENSMNSNNQTSHVLDGSEANSVPAAN